MPPATKESFQEVKAAGPGRHPPGREFRTRSHRPFLAGEERGTLLPTALDISTSSDLERSF